MGTRGFIGRQNKDKTIDFIYCHNDSDIDFLGKTLLQYHSDPVNVNKIIELGDASQILKSLEKPTGHDFNNPVKGYSVFYGRDRREDDCAAAKVDNEAKLIAIAVDSCDTEFVYIFKDEEWYVSDINGDDGGNTGDELCKLKERKEVGNG